MNSTLHSLSELSKWAGSWKSSAKLPVLFIGHGNPMNAIEENEYRSAWRKIGESLPALNAILMISAHWETSGTRITATQNPTTIHDFFGFPPLLFEQKYPAPGHPELASAIKQQVTKQLIELDHNRGLDHGTWSVLLPMLPDARIPVLQLSLDRLLSPPDHFALGKELASLRRKGVLIIGSGNIVHNLRAMRMDGTTYDWARDFDFLVKSLIETRSFHQLVQYKELGTAAQWSIPTSEHFLPLLYSLSALEPTDQLGFFNESIDLGSVSMRSFITHH